VANNLLGQRRAQMSPSSPRHSSRAWSAGAPACRQARARSSWNWAPHRGVFSWWRREVLRLWLRRRLLRPRRATSCSTFWAPGTLPARWAPCRGTPALVRVRVREAGTVLLIDTEQLRRIVQNDAELSELFMRAFILRRMSVIESGHSEVLLLGSDHSAALAVTGVPDA